MIEIALTVLTLPDGGLVFQRRDAKAPSSPKLLGLFGGHMDEGETHQEAMVRELAEETSLDPVKTDLRYLEDFTLVIPPGKGVHYYLYVTEIPNMNFKVLEGVRAEAYSIEEAKRRTDLAPSCEYVVNRILGDK